MYWTATFAFCGDVLQPLAATLTPTAIGTPAAKLIDNGPLSLDAVGNGSVYVPPTVPSVTRMTATTLQAAGVVDSWTWMRVSVRSPSGVNRPAVSTVVNAPGTNVFQT